MTNNILNKITRNPDICHKKPTVRGLRYPVDMLLDLMALGMSNQEILDDFEDLQMDNLLACLRYAAIVTHTKTTHKIAL
jgi:uncharacterized protein (DUF433 family)